VNSQKPSPPSLPALEPALQATAAAARRTFPEHPDPEALAAYHEGELDGAEAELLRDHLALCPDCAQLLLDLAAFADLAPPAGTRGLTDGEVDAAWQAVRPRLDGEREAPPASNLVRLPQIPTSPRPSRSLRPAYRTWALAASWVAVVGLGLWVVTLQRGLGRRSGASAEVAVADLAAVGGDSTRGREEPREPLLPATRRLVLHLVAAGLPTYGGYEVEIQEADATGRAVWSGRAERDPVESDFTVDLPSGFLHPGRYQLHLYGRDAGLRRKMADFTFQVGAS
jgi:hypothetical protein